MRYIKRYEFPYKFLINNSDYHTGAIPNGISIVTLPKDYLVTRNNKPITPVELFDLIVCYTPVVVRYDKIELTLEDLIIEFKGDIVSTPILNATELKISEATKYSHGVYICYYCQTIVRQCKCMQHTQITHIICENCSGIPKEEEVDTTFPGPVESDSSEYGFFK
jgi:hypothetical protein